MKYLLLAFSLFVGAQASSASVVYSFTTVPEGRQTPFSFSFDESTFLTTSTTIPDADLLNVSGLPHGSTLDSIALSFYGDLITVTENLDRAFPVSYYFGNGPWTTPGVYCSFDGDAEMTITNSAPAVPEPGEFGLVLLGGGLIMSFLRRGANSSQRFRS